ncbi:hypothetical protein [Fibrivirga algicola]|uniref:Uncharacterized protein n=1 Tax=Fibrivirga algicola TaxID=2950420 RepID=A0ABX0Q9R1_9BACT|nr:hypothetical protein [Fibrivirga algicola]ARK08907.1 hypothetical protein A6C57_00500 [Fibrella sp. ES10-3-2-2]NID08915.1 hypothetical protein [Fibrivirga algicola]
MKSVLAILLVHLMLGSSLLPGFGIDQSARWVELANHYQQHRETDASLGFFSFLMMHYDASSDHQKHPSHNHHNLPVAGQSLSISTPTPLRLDVTSESMSVLHLAKATFFRKADLYAFTAIRALINPPRR